MTTEQLVAEAKASQGLMRTSVKSFVKESGFIKASDVWENPNNGLKFITFFKSETDKINIGFSKKLNDSIEVGDTYKNLRDKMQYAITTNALGALVPKFVSILEDAFDKAATIED